MENDNKAIEYSKRMIKDQVIKGKYSISGMPFTKYQKVYFSSNENIKEYLNLVDFNNKNNALTVMGSGDHLFNLINKGIKYIDTFDTNLLTKYFVLGLKYAMIKKYSYNEYLNIYSKLININTSLDDITVIINDLLDYMDVRYKKYWDVIINYNYKEQKEKDTDINLIYLLFINLEPVNFIKEGNIYLNSEEDYNKLKSIIDRINISFNNINATNLSKVYKEKYDFILLSNILDYFNKYFYKEFDIYSLKQYIEELKKILDDEGIIFLKYIFGYASKNFTRSNLFTYPNINKSNFVNEEIYKIKSLSSHCYDGVIITKKY